MEEEYLKLFHQENDLQNSLVLGSLLPRVLWEPLPHVFKTWLRIYISAFLFYSITAFLWCFFVYYAKRKLYVLPQDDNQIPQMKTVVSSIYVSVIAIPFYAVPGAITDSILIERGWTKCFLTVAEVGWNAYFMYIVIYLVLLEFLTYWLHRSLHEIKPLYNHIHSIHHVYNSKASISPFTGFALHPVEGWMLYLPHLLAVCIVPTHFATHHAIMFTTALWTINIHDCIDGNSWPMLGAGHHTIHHIVQRRNYGLFTVFMDIIFGTFRDTTKV